MPSISKELLLLTFAIRFPIQVYYEDACGAREYQARHFMLLPHEIVGTFYRFKPKDLMARLTGKPGAPLVQSSSLLSDKYDWNSFIFGIGGFVFQFTPHVA